MSKCGSDGDQYARFASKDFYTETGCCKYLYIYRDAQFVASLPRLGVEVNGIFIGYSANRTYFYKEVKPGKLIIKSKAGNEDTLTFETVAGKLYFVRQETLMGWTQARTKLHLVGDEEGQRAVLETKLAESK